LAGEGETGQQLAGGREGHQGSAALQEMATIGHGVLRWLIEETMA